jgi:hypothetical protein
VEHSLRVHIGWSGNLRVIVKALPRRTRRNPLAGTKLPSSRNQLWRQSHRSQGPQTPVHIACRLLRLKYPTRIIPLQPKRGILRTKWRQPLKLYRFHQGTADQWSNWSIRAALECWNNQRHPGNQLHLLNDPIPSPENFRGARIDTRANHEISSLRYINQIAAFI